MLASAVLVEVQLSENLPFDGRVGIGGDYLEGVSGVRIDALGVYTLSANTVFPPFSIHFVTAPPAPSPKLLNSSIRFSILAIRHPSSSKSSTSDVLPFSKLNLSNASSPLSPFMLPSRSMPTPPSLRSEYDDPTAEEGSGVPCCGCRSTY